MKFSALEEILHDLIPNDGRPVVAYSGIWNLASAFEGTREHLVPSTLNALLSAIGDKRTLSMPTYTSGFGTAGFINLDTAPCFTGAVNEAFRKLSDSKRTASAFFSFAARGPEADILSSLRPEYAWGDRSVFEWIHKSDAHLVMIGVPLHMCSFLHRVEWLGRVPYRYNKTFRGKIVLQGREEELTEQLFVRSYDPVAENVWPAAEALLEGEGLMKRRTLGRGSVLSIRAKPLVDRLIQELELNPYAFVKNPEILKAKFGMPAISTRRV